MTTAVIERIVARRVWDSRGRPTVEADVIVTGGAIGRAIAPAGASTGSNEAVELRDGGTEFDGYGVSRAVAMIQTVIAPALRGISVSDQAAIDAALIALDGTRNKARLGGNATIAVSMAALHAAAAAAHEPLWRYLAGGAPPPSCRCRWSRSSAAARMRRSVSTSRIFSSCRSAPARSTRRWR